MKILVLILVAAAHFSSTANAGDYLGSLADQFARQKAEYKECLLRNAAPQEEQEVPAISGIEQLDVVVANAQAIVAKRNVLLVDDSSPEATGGLTPEAAECLAQIPRLEPREMARARALIRRLERMNRESWKMIPQEGDSVKFDYELRELRRLDESDRMSDSIQELFRRAFP